MNEAETVQPQGAQAAQPQTAAQAQTLREVPIGSTVRVTKVTGEGALRRHIMDMGITKGVQILVRKVAPLGDPLELTVRGYELSLRKSEAEHVLVEPVA
jgi:ferrous iron transport protein A